MKNSTLLLWKAIYLCKKGPCLLPSPLHGANSLCAISLCARPMPCLLTFCTTSLQSFHCVAVFFLILKRCKWADTLWELLAAWRHVKIALFPFHFLTHHQPAASLRDAAASQPEQVSVFLLDCFLPSRLKSGQSKQLFHSMANKQIKKFTSVYYEVLKTHNFSKASS